MPDLVSATWPASVLAADDWEAYEKDMEDFGQILEEELDGIHGAVTVLGDDDFRDVLGLCVLVVVILAVEEHDDVRILLQGARLTQV